ncbi:TPA: phage holin family protein, partial [Streptococcus suis]|nr:phage holin family protein [Streptococcus suis]
MKELLTLNKILFSMIGGLIGSLFGELDGILYALLVFIIIDYLTGIFAAVVEKQLSSSIGFRGIFKKI